MLGCDCRQRLMDALSTKVIASVIHLYDKRFRIVKNKFFQSTRNPVHRFLSQRFFPSKDRSAQIVKIKIFPDRFPGQQATLTVLAMSGIWPDDILSIPPENGIPTFPSRWSPIICSYKIPALKNIAETFHRSNEFSILFSSSFLDRISIFIKRPPLLDFLLWLLSAKCNQGSPKARLLFSP